MKFQFSLASVLKLRTLLESQHRALLEQARSRLRAVDSKILQAKAAAYVRDLEHLKLLTSNGMQGAALHFTTLQLVQSRDAIVRLCEFRKRLAADVDEQRSKYLAAKQSLGVVNSLYEQALEIHQRDQSRKEQAAVDEMFLLRLGAAKREQP